MKLLFNEQTSNANGTPILLEGLTTITKYGTWDTATVILQISGRVDLSSANIPSESWVDIPDASSTSDATYDIEKGEVWVRAVISSVGGSTSVTVTANPLRSSSSVQNANS